MSALLLKLIAAFTMLIDHAGLILFPGESWMRIVGRLDFPLYAYFIAEGFRYTRSRLRYFLGIFLLGCGCQAVCWIVDPYEMLGILLTFSFSLALMALMEKAMAKRRFIPLFLAALLAVFVFCRFVDVDYGFFGVILPLFPVPFTKRRSRILAFSLGLVLLCVYYAAAGNVMQSFCLLSLVLLALYNGERGRYKLKWFFYVFYPLHLAVLWGIAWIL